MRNKKFVKNYTLTALVENDLRAAKAWSLRRWGEKPTKQYFSDLHEGAQYIAKNHESFMPRGDLAGGTELSLYPVREHYLVYHPVSKNHVVILAVLRQGRDIPAILNKGHRQIRRGLEEITNKIARGEIKITI